MIDWLYNFLILVLVLVWVGAMHGRFSAKMTLFVFRHIRVVTVSLWCVLLVALVTFSLGFQYLERSHDVDDAVQSAVENFLDGTNPYASPVVPRFKEMGHFTLIGGYGDEEIVWAIGPYNYLPLDLLFYSGSYLAFGFLGSPAWFVAVNMLLSSIALIILNRLAQVRWSLFLPVAGCAVLILAFDNSSLTLLLMVCAIYVRERSRTHQEALSILVFGIATLTKVFAAIPLVVLLIYDLQKHVKVKDIRKIVESFVSLAICAVVAIVLLIPFGIANVLDSTVFIYSSGETRDDRPMGGTILSELIPGSQFYSIISAVSVFCALALGLRFRDANDRVILVAIVFLLVSVKSTLAPFVVPALFLAMRVSRNDPQRSASRTEPDAMRLGGEKPD